MNFIKALELTKQHHKALLAIGPNNPESLSQSCSLVTSSLRYLISDIEEHSRHGSGPRRKLWHEIIDDLIVLSKNANLIETLKGDVGHVLGVDDDYDKIISKMRDLGV